MEKIHADIQETRNQWPKTTCCSQVWQMRKLTNT